MPAMTTVIAATENGLFRLGSSRGVELEGRNLSDVAPGTDGWWAIADGSTVVHRPPHEGWREVGSSGGHRLNCLWPTDMGVFVGTDRAHLLTAAGDALDPVKGFEEAPGRAEWYTPWGGPPDVRSITSAGGVLFVNVHVGGILRSDDAGDSWSATIDINSDVHEVAVAGDGSVLAATAWGLARSRDGVRSWTFDDTGLHAPYARAVAVSSEHVFITASLGPRGGRAAIFRGNLGDAGFEKIHTGLPEWFTDNIDTGCVAADDGIVALGTSDGRAFLSVDDGDTWQQLADDLPPVRKVLLDSAGG